MILHYPIWAATLIALSSSAIAHQEPLSDNKAGYNNNNDDNDDTPLPLIIWHGLGDTFSAPGLRSVGDVAEQANPGTFVYFVHIGADANADRSATWFGNVTEQIETVCADVMAHPILSTAPAVDALGLSQGGQFIRGLLERCDGLNVRTLLTFGSQHNGIAEFKECGDGDWMCRSAMALLRGSTWSAFVQGRLVPAQYFRDPEQYAQYLEHSNFLADINNERAEKNEVYKHKMAALTNFVMYMFEDDTVAIPKESSWFEEVNGTVNTPLRARTMYSEDWLGLRELDRKGGLRFKSSPGDHMQLNDETLMAAFKEFYGPMGKRFAVDGMDEL